MSTHDYDIANQSGVSLLSDLNSLLQAIKSSNSSVAASSPTLLDYQWWVNTDTNKLMIKLPVHGLVEFCDIDTGIFANGLSVASTTTLTGLTNSNITAQGNSDTILSTPGVSNIATSDLTGNSITSTYVQNIAKDASYTVEALLDGSNATGTTAASASSTGDYIITSSQLQNVSEHWNYAEGRDKLFFKPFRPGTYKVKLIRAYSELVTYWVNTSPGVTYTSNAVGTTTNDLTLLAGEYVVFDVSNVINYNLLANICYLVILSNEIGYKTSSALTDIWRYM